VHNTKLGIWTLWELSKFEERLEQMREMYDNGVRDDSEEIDNLFHDPTEDWQEAFTEDSDATKDTPASG